MSFAFLSNIARVIRKLFASKTTPAQSAKMENSPGGVLQQAGRDIYGDVTVNPSKEEEHPTVTVSGEIVGNIARLIVLNEGGETHRFRAQMYQILNSHRRQSKMPYSIRWQGNTDDENPIISKGTGVLNVAELVGKDDNQKTRMIRFYTGNDRLKDFFTISVDWGSQVILDIEVSAETSLADAPPRQYALSIRDDGEFENFNPRP